MKREYPEIGSHVSYVRADQDGQIYDGEGKVMAIFIGPDKRLMVQVRDLSNAWNVDLAAINPDADFRARYADAIFEVQRLTKEGNELVKKTVDEFNAKVEDAYRPVLGDFLEIEFPEVKKAPDGEDFPAAEAA